MKTAPLLPLPMPKGARIVPRVSRATLADLAAARVIEVHPGAGGVRRTPPGGLTRLSVWLRQLFNKGGRS